LRRARGDGEQHAHVSVFLDQRFGIFLELAAPLGGILVVRRADCHDIGLALRHLAQALHRAIVDHGHLDVGTGLVQQVRPRDRHLVVLSRRADGAEDHFVRRGDRHRAKARRQGNECCRKKFPHGFLPMPTACPGFRQRCVSKSPGSTQTVLSGGTLFYIMSRREAK
jgi:hypothetical protein